MGCICIRRGRVKGVKANNIIAPYVNLQKRYTITLHVLHLLHPMAGYHTAAQRTNVPTRSVHDRRDSAPALIRPWVARHGASHGQRTHEGGEGCEG